MGRGHAISPDHALAHGDGGEVRVDDRDFVAMAHLAQDGEQFGGEDRVNKAQHGLEAPFGASDAAFSTGDRPRGEGRPLLPCPSAWPD
jgi:hypothetical protein